MDIAIEKTQAKILIVDDNPSVLYTLEMLLSSEPYEITFASDGVSALRQITDEHPDVVLLDVMMPNMTGFEVCERIRTSDDLRHIPVILITAMDEEDGVLRGLNAGADEFLKKPVDGSELRARVRTMLRVKRQYDALEETLALREQLADMIVHDMRGPLSNIILYSSLIDRTEQLSDAGEKYMSTIRTQANRLEAFLSDLLLTAKMSSGELILSAAGTELVNLVTKAANNISALAATRGIQLHLDVPPGEVVANVDERLMQRAVENLLSNAVKFSPADGLVTIRLRAREHANGYGRQIDYLLEIIDEGPGIPAEYRDQVFERFGTAPNAPEGIMQFGLGLALCKLVANAHGGAISAHPNQPQGTIMRLEFGG